ncbi:MAG: hypothetical protein FWG18_01410, partial [Alphaproteobacteria bacterium]|nr:hypothetical protein [Alphaproteobacteria bacterium]
MSYYDDDDRDEKRIPLAFNDQDFAKTSGYFRAILKRLYPKKVKYRDWGADKETYHDIKVIIFDNPYIEDDRWNSRPSDCYLDTDAMWLSKQIIQSVQSVDQLAHIISFQGSEHGDYKEIAIRMARAGFNPVNNLLGTFPEMISDNNKSRFEVALTAAIRELAEKYGISAGEGGGILSSSLDPEILKIVSDASPRVKIDFIDQQFDNLKFDTLNLDEKIKAIGMVAHAINESKDEKFRHYNWNRDKNQSREKFEARVITVMREILELAPHVIIKKSEYKEGYPDDKESPVVLSVRDQINAFGWHRGETRVYDVRMSKRYPFKIVPDEEFDAAVAENAKRKFDGKYEYALLNELYAENKGNKFTSLCRLATHHMPCVNLRKAGKVGRDFIRMAKHAFLGDEKYKDYSDNYYKLRDIQELFGNGDSDAVGHLISQMVSPDHVPVIRFSGLPKSDITIGAELPFAKPKQIETLFGIYTSSEWSSEALHLSNGDFTLCHFNPKTKISTWILIGKDKSVLKHFETKEEYDKFRKDAINEATERLCKIIAKYVTLRIKTTRALIASKTRMAKIPIAKLIELKKITGQESYHPRFSRQDYYNYSDIKNKSGWQTVRNAFRVDEYGMFMSNGRANPKLDIEKIFKDIKDREKKKDPLLTSVEFSKSAIMKHISKSNQDWLNNIDESEDEQVFKVLCDRATRIPQKFLKDFWEHKPVFRTYGSDEYIHDNEDKQEAVRCIRGFTMHQFAELLYYMNDRKSKSKKDITDLQRYVEIQNLNMYFKAGGHYELFDRVNHYFYDDESDTLKDLVINKDNKFPLADISKLPLESGYCAGLAEEMIKVYLRLAFDIAENWPTDAKTATDITKKRYYTNDKTCAIFADIAVKDTNPDNIR